MCTLVATNLSNPACGHRLVDCLYTTPRHATCEYASPYQPITAFTLPVGQGLASERVLKEATKDDIAHQTK
jgi:hypothetical protein